MGVRITVNIATSMFSSCIVVIVITSYTLFIL